MRRYVLDLSRHSPKSLVGRALRLLLPVITKGLAMPILRGPARGLRWVIGTGIYGPWLGMYESEKVRLLAGLLREGDVAYDIGAHAGYYTLVAARLVGRTGSVVAFEPNPENIRALRRHLVLNRVQNVEVVEAAVSDRTGTARFDDSDRSNSRGRLSYGGSLEVSCVALDALIGGNGLPAPAVIKMDIEGGECLAIDGARELLVSARPMILLATHGPAIRARAKSLLRDIGYDMAPLAPSRDANKCSEWVCSPRPERKNRDSSVAPWLRKRPSSPASPAKTRPNWLSFSWRRATPSTE